MLKDTIALSRLAMLLKLPPAAAAAVGWPISPGVEATTLAPVGAGRETKNYTIIALRTLDA